MSVETRKVLEMLTEGKITAADAERILDKLSSTAQDVAQPSCRHGIQVGTRTPVPRMLEPRRNSCASSWRSPVAMM